MRLRVVTVSAPEEIQESRIFNDIDFHYGDGYFWNRFEGNPRDLHWFFFRTGRSCSQGTPLILEAGVQHMSWFETNDMSITMRDNNDLRSTRSW